MNCITRENIENIRRLDHASEALCQESSPGAGGIADAELSSHRLAIRPCQLSWFHWLTLAASLTITLLAWHASNKLMEKEVQTLFNREAQSLAATVQNRLLDIDSLLSGTASSGMIRYQRLTEQDWRDYLGNHSFLARLPEISGIGIIPRIPSDKADALIASLRVGNPGFVIHPPTTEDQEYLLPIVSMGPLQDNEALLGWDMTGNAADRETALLARNTGTSQMRSPAAKNSLLAGPSDTLVYFPYYAVSTPWTLQDRRIHFAGLVFARLSLDEFFDQSVQSNGYPLQLRVTDGEVELYTQNRDKDQYGYDTPAYQQTLDLTAFGRVLSLQIGSTEKFTDTAESSQPMLILLGGILLNAVLIALIVSTVYRQRKATQAANRASAALEEKSRLLQEHNASLESFAYIVSHDLKSPLHNVADLLDFLEDNLSDYLKSADANPEVGQDIGLIRSQIDRMDKLIKGVLEYSTIGMSAEQVEPVDTRLLVEDIALSQGHARERVQLEGDFPVLETYRVRLEQTLANLIGNAFKYNPDTSHARVTVKVVRFGDYYSFSVIDNGPGIERRFHERIFEVFQCLQSGSGVDGTGIGLSIVKKAVESVGGSITVESTPGDGTTFRFLWPATHEPNH